MSLLYAKGDLQMKLPLLRLAALWVFALSAASCATITRGSNDVLIVNSDPSGAKVTTSTGLSGTTPATFTVNRRGGFVVKIEKQGFETVEVQISSKIHGAGGTALAGNLLIGGLIGVAVDAGTGAAYDLVPNPLNVKLVSLAATGVGNQALPRPQAPIADAVPIQATEDEKQRAVAALLRLTVGNLEVRTSGGYLLADFVIANDNDFAVAKLEVECLQDGIPRRTSTNEYLKRSVAAHGKARYAGVAFGEARSGGSLSNCRVWRMEMPGM
jgi:hypothetical protein